jgi:hypothetical protein
VATKRKRASTARFNVTWNGKTLKVTPRWPKEIYERGMIFHVISDPEDPWEIQSTERGKRRKGRKSGKR